MIDVITSSDRFTHFQTGWMLYQDAKGRIVVEVFDDLHAPLPLRYRKLRIVASNPDSLAKQFGEVYDADYYSF